MVFAGLVGIGLVVGYFQWQHKQREIGAARVEAADAKAVAAEKERQAEQLQREQDATNDAINALQAERERLTADLLAKPAPVARLCIPTPRDSSGLPGKAGTASSASEAATIVGNSADVPGGIIAGPNIGEGLRDIALLAERLGSQNRALLFREKGLSDVH